MIICDLFEIIDLNKTLINALEYSSENGEDSSYIIRLAKIIHEKLTVLKEQLDTQE